jgi:hypothetical protein
LHANEWKVETKKVKHMKEKKKVYTALVYMYIKLKPSIKTNIEH